MGDNNYIQETPRRDKFEDGRKMKGKIADLRNILGSKVSKMFNASLTLLCYVEAKRLKTTLYNYNYK